MACQKCGSKTYERQQYCATEQACFIAVGCPMCNESWEREKPQFRHPSAWPGMKMWEELERGVKAPSTPQKER